MSLLLNVPYAEKDEAKSLGARWNPELRKWYVTDKKDYHKFTKWYEDKNANLIIMDHLYIIIGKQNCFKCKEQTNVLSFASDLYYSIDDECFELFDEDINFITDFNINVNKITLVLQYFNKILLSPIDITPER